MSSATAPCHAVRRRGYYSGRPIYYRIKIAPRSDDSGREKDVRSPGPLVCLSCHVLPTAANRARPCVLVEMAELWAGWNDSSVATSGSKGASKPAWALCTPTGRSCSTGRRAVEPGDDAEAHALGGHRPRRRRGRAGRVGKWLAVETAASAVGCEGCGTRSVGHGRRRVKVQDLPMANRPVVLVWAKRIWRCPDPDSPVTTWSEEVDEIAP